MSTSEEVLEKTGSDGVTPTSICGPCNSHGTETEAEHFCVDCRDFLCGVCTLAHRGLKPLKNHVLFKTNNMPSVELLCWQYCLMHTDARLEMFCLNHDIFCCKDCYVDSHKNCKVKAVKEIADGYETTDEYRHLRSSLEGMTLRLEKMSEQSKTNTNHLGEMRVQMLADIGDFRESINTMLDHWEESIIEEVKNIIDVKEDAMKNVSKSCQEINHDLQVLSSSLDELQRYNLREHLVVKTKSAQDLVKVATSKVEELGKRCYIGKYTFERNADFVELLQTTSELGKIINKHDECSNSPTAIEENDGTVPERAPANGMQMIEGASDSSTNRDKQNTFSFNRQIKVTEGDERRPVRITGSSIIGNDIIAFVDCENGVIKSVDVRDSKDSNTKPLSGEIWDITNNAMGGVVLTCSDKLVFLDQDLSVTNEVKLQTVCKGIASNDNVLCVTLIRPEPCVKVLDLEGSVLDTFIHGKQGQGLFDAPDYIAITSDGISMIVTDRKRQVVTSLTLHGDVNFIYKHETLRSPQGVVMDDVNNIYVAGYFSHNIHQISPDGQLIQIILQDQPGVFYPRSLTWHQDLLYVKCSHPVDRNSVSVFKKGQN